MSSLQIKNEFYDHVISKEIHFLKNKKRSRTGIIGIQKKMPAMSQKRQKEADIAEISQVKVENQAKR